MNTKNTVIALLLEPTNSQKMFNISPAIMMNVSSKYENVYSRKKKYFVHPDWSLKVSSRTLLGMYLFIHAGIEVDLC